jgi:hypothetical protein
VFFRDITARKEAEELRSDLHRQLASAKEEAEQAAKAVAEATERFRLFSEIVSLQVWTALPIGALDYANPDRRQAGSHATSAIPRNTQSFPRRSKDTSTRSRI